MESRVCGSSCVASLLSGPCRVWRIPRIHGDRRSYPSAERVPLRAAVAASPTRHRSICHPDNLNQSGTYRAWFADTMWQQRVCVIEVQCGINRINWSRMTPTKHRCHRRLGKTPPLDHHVIRNYRFSILGLHVVHLRALPLHLTINFSLC